MNRLSEFADSITPSGVVPSDEKCPVDATNLFTFIPLEEYLEGKELQRHLEARIQNIVDHLPEVAVTTYSVDYPPSPGVRSYLLGKDLQIGLVIGFDMVTQLTGYYLSCRYSLTSAQSVV